MSLQAGTYIIAPVHVLIQEAETENATFIFAQFSFLWTDTKQDYLLCGVWSFFLKHCMRVEAVGLFVTFK